MMQISGTTPITCLSLMYDLQTNPTLGEGTHQEPIPNIMYTLGLVHTRLHYNRSNSGVSINHHRAPPGSLHP